jgi:polysaccharide biosynthesis/export protein
MLQGWRFIKLAALVPLLTGLIGCAGDLSKSSQTAKSAGNASSESITASSQTVRSPGTHSSTMASSLTYADVSDDATDYRITSQDILQVAVFQVKDLDRTVRVDGSGSVSLPLIGRVPVRGKTIAQAQDDISARYAKSYLQSPQVTVSLVKSGQRVTVNGAVKNPTVLTIEGPLTLTMAIAQSGGLSELGNSSRVHVARPTGQEVEDQVHNLDDIQAGKAPNPVLRGGDIVVVEDSTTKVAFKNVKDVLPFAALGAVFLSDVLAKRDITPVAELENGLRLYQYRYVWSDPLYVGVLAQEVLEVVPSAVLRGADGYLRVDYARLGLRLQPWEDWIASRSKLEDPAESHMARQ